jgi:ankyrin repeat protein
MVAAQSGRVETIRFLLKNGAKASLMNDRSETAIHYAASSLSFSDECIAALLEQQRLDSEVDLVNVQDCDGSTALMVAARNQSSSKSAAAAAVSILLKLGADVSLVDNQQRTALHWAAQSNLPDVVTLLHAANIEVDAIDSFGDTAYVTAIKSNSPDALESLIRVGCDRSMIDGLMGTALALASLQGHAKVIEILVKHGDDIDDIGYFGKTPLILASCHDRVDAVDMLLSLGADPDLPDRIGGTALAAALYNTNSLNEANRHQIVISLIRAGVNVNLPAVIPMPLKPGSNSIRAFTISDDGRNWPLSYAVDTGYVSLIKILLLAGSTIPANEVRHCQSVGAKFFDIDELLAPILSWSSRPVSLQHACRMVIRCAILARWDRCSGSPSKFNFKQATLSLPVADQLQRYINFAELDSIQVQRAGILDGVGVGMMQLERATLCGTRSGDAVI